MRYVETEKHIKPCPFCGMNRQYITVDRPAGIQICNIQAYLGQVHCHVCKATTEGVDTREDRAIRLAICNWMARIPPLEKHPKPIRTEQGRARA